MKMGYGPWLQVLECAYRQSQHCLLRLFRLALPQWFAVENAKRCPQFQLANFVAGKSARGESRRDGEVIADCVWLTFLGYGSDFVGGEFVFIDDDADRVLHPRQVSVLRSMTQ